MIRRDARDLRITVHGNMIPTTCGGVVVGPRVLVAEKRGEIGRRDGEELEEEREGMRRCGAHLGVNPTINHNLLSPPNYRIIEGGALFYIVAPSTLGPTP